MSASRLRFNGIRTVQAESGISPEDSMDPAADCDEQRPWAPLNSWRQEVAEMLVGLGVEAIWAWLKIKDLGQTAGFGPCFHLPGQPILEFRFFEPQPYVCHRGISRRVLCWRVPFRLEGRQFAVLLIILRRFCPDKETSRNEQRQEGDERREKKEMKGREKR